MPSGYETRQSSRETFATPTRAPVQGSAGQRASSRGIQLVGGESRGEVVRANPGDVAPIAGELGEFFAGLVQPYVEQKQTERFFEGYTAMQAGASLEEVGGSNKGLSKIFGPTGFEQGAQFYAAKKQVSDWQTGLLQDEELKKLPASEAAKVIAEKSRSMMTGNAGADRIIQTDILEASGPLMAVVAKERYKHQQTEARARQTEAWHGGASGVQALLSKDASLSDPADPTTIAARSAVVSFRASMGQPDGMDEETYRDSLYDFMGKAMQDGNFYAVSIMRQAGIDDIFDDEKKAKLESSYDKHGMRVLNRQAVNHRDELIALDAKIKFGKISPLDAANAKANLNEKLKRETGVDLDLFDYKDQAGAAGSVTSALLASLQRAESRQWQVEDRERGIEARREDEAKEEAEEASQVGTIWSMGTAAEAIVLEPKLKSGFDKQALADYRGGTMENIAQAFTTSGFTSAPTANIMQADVTASIGEEFSTASKRAHSTWSKLNALRPSAAAAYYGQYHTSMQAFDRLRRGGQTDQQAWQRAFGDPTIHGTADIPRADREAVTTTIADVLEARDAGGYFDFGEEPLNASSVLRVTNAISNKVVVASKNSGIGAAQHARDALEQGQRDGSIEIYDQFAIVNRPGTTPLYKMLGVQQAEATSVLKGVMTRELRRVGFSRGVFASELDGDNYDIIRLRGPDGNPVLSVTAYGDTPDEHRTVVIPFADLRAAVTGRVNKEVKSKALNPYRNKNYNEMQKLFPPKAGESPAQHKQRVSRIWTTGK